MTPLNPHTQSRLPIKPVKCLTPAQTDALLAYTSRHATREYPLYKLALETGARLHEIISLTVDDLVYAGHIVHTLHIRASIAKRQHPREIPLQETTREILALYHQNMTRNPAGSPTYQQFFLFSWPTRPYTPRTLQRKILTHSALALGQPITFHVLRHTFADRLRKVVDLPTLQKLLGHHHLSSTQIYMHPTHDDMRTAIQQAFQGPNNKKGATSS